MKELKNGFKDDQDNSIIVGERVDFGKSDLEFLEVGATVEIGEDTKISHCHIKLGRNAKLIVGKGCHIDGRIFVGAHSTVTIGDDFTVTGNVYLRAVEATKITIGNDVIVAAGVTVRTNDGHTIHDLISGERINPSKDIVVADHVWLGDEVAVLKGVEIGEGCVVGMRSVVTKSIPANSLAVGLPAKVLKQNITWKR
ncbi:acyltransferase [Vibrio diabolicus]|uniref:acyltransferase n=1 Tax=Vibrio diabolicus TaxID=50719 RepID=UPI0014284B8D|nr:acyltransferase [Vibrio diabolicus]QIS00562.1 acyltransferase [Vibrio diabolicus]